MKGLRARAELIDYHLFARISILAVTAVVSFYVGRHWSDPYPQLAFFSAAATSNVTAPRTPPLPVPLPSSSAAVALSPNDDLPVSAASIVLSDSHDDSVPAAPPQTDHAPPPPPPVRHDRIGFLDGNGTMTKDFDAGGFDADLPDEPDDGGIPGNESAAGGGEGGWMKGRIRVEKFPECPESMREYIPCMDNEEEIKRLQSTERGERFERHCPTADKVLDCLVPKPKGYKTRLPWPQSRDEVWYNNVPHTRLVDDKGGQNWIKRAGEKFIFPGGGTQFIHGANQYLDQISQMVPDIAFGKHTRVALDIGCGVASFGAFLLSRNVTTMSIAPKDVHENQIQFALERGVPAMVAAVATQRLPYPSQAFDLVHCSRCRINWTRDDGILLLEVNRLLRAGGYFVWAAQPVYKHEESQQEAWKVMENLTRSICWQFVQKEGYIAIWQKPLNNSCYETRDYRDQPPLCDTDDQPNKVWYVKLKPCISRLPDNGFGSNITEWPIRLNEPPQRLQEVEMDAYVAKYELFKAESAYWKGIIEDIYVRVYHWDKLQLRNVMDMRAGFGGFAAALIKHLDCWVMNVVPIIGPNTLPVIYDRGLIGVMHDWCEPFDSYPRTYDLLHASGLFSKERKRCNISVILLEMDRLLRPGGKAYIRDSKHVVEEVEEIAKAIGWRTNLRDSEEGSYASRKDLLCDKPS